MNTDSHSAKLKFQHPKFSNMIKDFLIYVTFYACDKSKEAREGR
jgi:hypothetical protein